MAIVVPGKPEETKNSLAAPVETPSPTPTEPPPAPRLQAPAPAPAPAPDPAQGNPFFELDRLEGKQQRQAVKNSLSVVSGAEPDRQAQVLQLADHYKVDTGFVERNFDELQKDYQAKQVDVAGMVDRTPGLARFMANPDNAAVAKDDLGPLGRIEDGVLMLPSPPREPNPYASLPSDYLHAGKLGFNELSSAIAALGAAYGSADPDVAAQTIAESNRRVRELRAKEPDYVQEFNQTLAQKRQDVNAAASQFTGSFSEAKRGQILQALKDFGAGGGHTVADTLDLIYSALSRPRGLGYTLSEMTPQAAPSLLLGAAGGKAAAAAGGIAGSVAGPEGALAGAGVGGLAGFTAGSFLGDAPVQVGSYLNDELQRRGVDITDPAQIRQAFGDPKLLADVRSEAERRGLTISGINSLLHFFAGHYLAKAGAEGAGVLGKGLAVAKDVGVQAGGQVAADVGGQVAAKKGDLAQVDLAQSLQQGILTLGHSVGHEVVGASIRKAFHSDPAVAAEQVAVDTQKAVQAQQGAQALATVGQAVQESKLAKRLPGKLAELVDTATGGKEAATVYFQTKDWDNHWNSKGLSPAKAAESILNDGGRAYVEAKESGTPLAMPMSDYVAHVAPTEHFEELLPITRTQPDGMTLSQAHEFLQALPATMEELSKEASGKAEAQVAPAPDSAAQVGQKVTEQLKAAGFSEADAATYAKLFESRYSARAAILGEDPLKLFEAENLSILRPEIQDSTTVTREGVGAPSVPAFDPLDSQIDRVRAGDIPSDREARGASLVEFLRQKGGLKAEGPLAGDLKGLDAQGLIRKTGLSADEAAASAAESGYLSDANPSELIDALGAELRGNPRYSEQNADQGRIDQIDALSRLKSELGGLGIDLAKVDNAEAKRRLIENQGVRADVGFEQARVYEQAKILDASSKFANRKDAADLTRAMREKHGEPNIVDAMEKIAHHFGNGKRPLTTGELRQISVEIGRINERIDALPDGSPELDSIDYELKEYLRILEDSMRLGSAARKNEERRSAGLGVVRDNGVEYFQDARGHIRFTAEGEKVIKLFSGADLSTVLHEGGHLFLDEIRRDVETLNKTTPYQMLTDTQKAFLEDGKAVLKWLGVDSWEKVGEPQHEQWARGFEAYLLEGKAPSSALREAFARFRSWLVAIYKNVAGLDVKLSPEIRGVFDRLVASEEEIAAAETQQHMAPLFADPAAVGMGPEEAKRYQDAVLAARQSAEETLANRVMRQEMAKKKAAYLDQREKVREEIASEVHARPEQVALANLQKGTLPDGSPLPEGAEAIKLDRDAIVRQFGESRLKQLPRPYVYAREGGVHPDLAANLFGFSSGDELLHALEHAPKASDLIDHLTDERMRSLHGDLLTDGTLPVESMKAIHNEKRAQLLRMELSHLASENLSALKGMIRRVARPVPPLEAVRRAAEASIAGRKVREILPSLHQRAEAQAAREAVDALLKGDISAAFEAKERELKNHELYRAAVDARERIDAAQAYAKRAQKKAFQEKLGRAGADYREQFNSILERFDFRSSVTLADLKKRRSLQEFVEAQRKIGIEPELSDEVLTEAYRQSYKELTYEELRGVHDSLKSIERVASLKNKLLAAQAARDLNEVVDAGVASIIANSKGERPQKLEHRLPGKDQYIRAGAGFLAAHRTFSSLVQEMDGFKEGGPLWEALVLPVNRAGDQETTRLSEATQALHDVFSEYSAKEIRALYTKEFIPELNTSLTKMGQIVAALNWGNQGNRDRLLQGFGWTEAQAQAILKRLDARDWKAVQAIWNHLEGYWPEVAAIQERVTGVKPEKVEATPFTIVGNDGQAHELNGGYYPIKYEGRADARAYKKLAEAAAEEALRGARLRATTQHGHREARVESTGQPLRLDLGGLYEHVGQVVHDLTHFETLVDLNRILRHEKFQDAVFAHYGDQVHSTLVKAVADVAAGNIPAQVGFERGLNHLRRGLSVAYLGFNVVTAVKHVPAFLRGAVRVGPQWVAKGASRFLGDAVRMENTAAWVHEQSEFMANRNRTRMRELNEIAHRTRGQSGAALEIERASYTFIHRVLQMSEIPTWLGAYEKAMAEGPQGGIAEGVESMQKRASALADQAVIDAYGNGQVKDLPAIERGGPLLKVFTTFTSFFNSNYNLMLRSAKQTEWKSPASVAKLAVDYLTLYPMQVALGAALAAAVKGDKKDERHFAAEIIRENLAFTSGGILGLNQLMGALTGRGFYEGPAGLQFVQPFYHLARKTVDEGLAAAGLEHHKHLTHKQTAALEGDLFEAGGILFHYPTVQLERWFKQADAALGGKTH